MSTITKPIAKITFEQRTEPLEVGLAFGAEENSEYIADAVVTWSDAMQAEAGTDETILVNGQPVRPLVLAAAIRNAYVRMFDCEPIGIPFMGMPPLTKRLDAQEFVYKMLDGTIVKEFALNDHREWPLERISRYLEENAPEFQQPKYPQPHHRAELLAELRKGLDMISAPSRVINVPWGGIVHPANKNFIIAILEADGSEYDVDHTVGRMVIIAKKKNQALVDEFYETVLEELKTNSVYQGRMMSVDEFGRITFVNPFEGVRPNEIIIRQDMRYELEHECFGPIRHLDDVRKIDPRMFNKKFVFAGPVGTAKTITSYWAAQEALKNGISVVAITSTTDEGFDRAKKIAAQVAPVLFLVEDPEKTIVSSGGASQKEQLQQRSRLLDQFDGGDTKGKEVMWILITNFPKLWIPGMARPGRCDGYFWFEALDRQGFEQFLRLKLGARLSADIDFDALWEMGPEGAKVKDMASSFLAGLADKLRAYSLGKGADYTISQDDLAAAIRGQARQWGWFTELEVIEESKQETTLHGFFDSVTRPVVTDVVSAELTARGLISNK